jgi:DinB superfamily
MLNVKDPRKYTRSVRPLVPRSPEEQLALYARGPDELEAALAGLSREDLDQARFGHWTIRQIVEHVVDDDAHWTMCMQVALVRPGYTCGHEWFSGKRTEPWAGLWDGRDPAIAPVVTLLRTNRTHMLAVLHHLPAAWNRYVTFTHAAEQEAQTLTVGEMIGLQATHALEHIDEIRQARRMHRC